MGRAGKLILGMALVFGSGPVWADEPSSAELNREISDLKARLSALESKLAAKPASSAVSSEAAPGVSLPSGLAGVELTGFVDTAYNYNFNEPKDKTNDLRIFDTTANSFAIHNAELSLTKAVDESSPIGFGTVLMFGDDAELTHSAGLFAGTDSVDLQQAYVNYLAPVGNGLDIKAGKMATLIGAEVIESPANWNYSRAFLFGYAIPFTHTGVRVSYPVSETVTVTTGVNNGWDVANDTNIGKGIEAQVAWAPSDELSFFLNGMYSPEVSTASMHSDRYLADLVASYQATDELAFMLNYDVGFQEDVAAFGENATWQGIALYTKYDLSDAWSLAGRYEFFRDYDGSRTPVGTDLKLQEITLTSQHQIHENLIARLEYRHDQANSPVFTRDSSTTGEKNQDTVAVEFIMPF